MRKGRDTQLLMVLVSQAVTLGLGAAVYVGVLQQSSVSSLAALITPLAVGVISAIITVVHVTFAHKSYKAELGAGVVMPNFGPVGVGSGPPAAPAAPVQRGPEAFDAGPPQP